MKTGLLFLFLVIAVGVGAQNYHAYVPGRTAFFSQHLYNQDYSVDAISPDTSFVSGNYTVYHDYRREVTSSFSFSCLTVNDTGWAGKYFLQDANGVTCFLNKANDSIWFFPSAAVGQDGFIFPFANGDTLHGTVVSLAIQNVLGAPDSVKTMQLQRKDGSGNSVADDLNGKFIEVAKDHGCILAYSWRDFPDDTTARTLAGMSSPQEGVRVVPAADVFNFSIGDQFDIVDANNSNAMQLPSMMSYYTWVVTAKTVSANGDTIRYTMDENYCRKIVNSIQAQHMNTPVIYTFILSEYERNFELSLMPGQYANGPDTANSLFYMDGASFFPLNATQYNGRMQKGYSSRQAGYYYDQNSQCFLWDGDSPDICDGINEIYADGIGKVYAHDGSATCFDNYQLVYFSKGAETWGTPNNWPVILGNNELSAPVVRCWPDPAQDVLNVDAGADFNGSIHYQILDYSGRVVSEANLSASGSVIQIPVNELAHGFYIFKAETGGQTIYSRFSH